MRLTTGVVIVAVMGLVPAGLGAAQDCGWQWVNPAPPRVDILRLKYESHAFVGVGLRGTVIRSTDGFTWRTVDSGVSADLFGIDWGAGGYVAVGRGVILKSANGLDWSVVATDPSVTFLDVEFSASRYVAVGDGLDGQVLTSQVGETWQAVPAPWTGAATSVAGSPDGFFVAVGPEVWFSPDGFDWEYRSAVPTTRMDGARAGRAKKLGSDLFELDRVDLAWSDDRLLWAGGSELWSGIEGDAWQLVSVLDGCAVWQDWLAVIAGPGWAMASGIAGCPSPYLDPIVTLTFSTDGGASFAHSWQASLGGFPGLARYGARWIAAGALGDVLTSSNGIDWQCVAGSCTSSACADEFVDVAVGDAGLVAVGGVGLCDTNLKGRSGATVAASEGGSSWTIHPIDSDRFRAVTYVNDEYVGVGDGWVGRSQDGVQWQVEPFPDGTLLHGVGAGNGWVVAVGEHGALYVSQDGHSWQKPYIDFTEDLDRVVWDGAHFLALGCGGSIFRSRDALNWSVTLTSTEVDLKGAAAGPNGMIAVGESGVILASDDAQVWLRRRSGGGAHLADVAYGDGRFVAVGWDEAPDGSRPAVVLASLDGVQWTRVPAPGERLHGVAWTGDGWVAVGGDRTLLHAECLGSLLEVDRELLQLPIGATVDVELRLSVPVTAPTDIAVTASAPAAVQVPQTVTIGAGSDVVSVPVTGVAAATEAVLTFTLPTTLGGGSLTSLVTVQPPQWTPRRPGGRVTP
ncbi:MAG: hypothetical protein PVG53_04680 [Holophagae bacterium]